jgi:hypothetical protein
MDFEKGLKEAIGGIIGGVVQGVLLVSFSENGLIPAYVSWGFVLVGFVANIATVNSLKLAGVTYTIGWLAGSWLLRSMLSPVDFIVNIVAPLIFFAVKVWYWVKNGFD